MSMQNTKKVVTCDIDGILTDYPMCWLQYLQKECGVLYNTTEEARKSESKYSVYKDLYRNSAYKAQLPVKEDNKNYLVELSEQYDIVFATSRPINDKKYPKLYDDTYNWLKNNGLRFRELRYKDKDANFLNGLDVAFHIDDETKYAVSIAKKLRQKRDIGRKNLNNQGVVYLLTKNKEEYLGDNIIVLNDIKEISSSPFFSVCIPATNRGSTIYRAIKSVSEQTYRNFELVIVDCMSSDNTEIEVKRFFESNDYKEKSFLYTFRKCDYEPNGIEDWNEPLKLAKGKYIAMLEGDDYWLPEHLMNAYQAISSNPNIGLYGSSNLESQRPFEGCLTNKDARQYCYSIMDGAVPPSESIFIRCNLNNQPFIYNSKDYNYSPEIALYMEIVNDGKDIYYSKKQDVYREPSTNPNKLKTWFYFADRFKMISCYKELFDQAIYKKAIRYNVLDTILCVLYSKSFSKFLSITIELCKNVGFLTTIACSMLVLSKLLIRKFLHVRK